MSADRRAAALVLPAVVAVVAVLLSVLAAAAATRSSSRLADSVGDTHEVAGVLAAARTEVATALSYDYRHLDADFARATAVMTPAFRKKYLATTAKGVKPLAVKYKATSAAQVTSAGLVEGTRDRAVVLVFVAQTASNSQLTTGPRLDRSRIRTTLVRSGDRWLIDDLDPV